jgi:peptide methionine sulfoxide reductase MsrA
MKINLKSQYYINMGRKLLYHTEEEIKLAKIRASKRYYEKIKARREGHPVPDKPAPISYTKEYHQQYYQRRTQKKITIADTTVDDRVESTEVVD